MVSHERHNEFCGSIKGLPSGPHRHLQNRRLREKRFFARFVNQAMKSGKSQMNWKNKLIFLRVKIRQWLHERKKNRSLSSSCSSSPSPRRPIQPLCIWLYYRSYRKQILVEVITRIVVFVRKIKAIYFFRIKAPFKNFEIHISVISIVISINIAAVIM